MMTGTLGPSTRTWTAIAVVPALILVAFQMAWPLPFFSDDSFISLRYSARLLEGHGLSWTHDATGQPEYVEGYSNLLWVLLTSALGMLGVELVTAARVLGGVCTVLGLWWLAGALRPHDKKSAMVAAIAPLLVASTQPVMVWTLAGLEGPLVLALLAWGFAGLVRHFGDPVAAPTFAPATLLRCGLPFAFVCWTRPDGPLWSLMAGAGLFVMSWSQGFGTAVRRALLFGLPALLALSAQLAFRLAYYGDYVPNTAHVKAEFDPASIGPGFDYVWNAMLAMPGLGVAASVGVVTLAFWQRARAFQLALLLPVLAWLTYLTVIGGDHFPGLRLLHGVIVPLALLAAVSVRWQENSLTRAVLVVAFAIGASAWNVTTARTHPKSFEARAEQWEWHDKVVGDALGRAFAAEQPRLAVDSAGALPYYSKLPTLDMLGLCDRTIATTPFPAWLDTVREGTPRPPGHLRGNGDYVMQQKPDLIIFKSVLPVFVSGCEFEDDPRFTDHYRLVRFDADRPDLLPKDHRVPLWIRLDGKAGIVRTDDEITIPAYLFGSFRLEGPVINRWQPPTGDPAIDQAIAQNGGKAAMFWGTTPALVVPDDDGKLRLRLHKAQRATFSTTVPPGRYRVVVAPQGSGAALAVTNGGSLQGDQLTVTAGQATTFALTTGSDRNAELLRIVLHRTR